MRTSISSHFSNSTVNYTLKTDFSAHAHLMTFEELRLGFPKRSWLLKFIHMQTRGEPLKDEHFCELFDMSNFGAWKRNISFDLTFTMRRREARLNHQIYPQEYRFGFPKRPYFPKSIQMANRGEPLNYGSRPKQGGKLPTRKECRIPIHIL